MSKLEADRLNAKYSAFHLIRYSARSGRCIGVGKPRSTIEAALAAAKQMDRRNPGTFTFIDTVRP